jgi:polyferredoxin
MRQKIRRIILFVSLALFPVTMNYLSPYVSIDGAMAGVVSGSMIVFFLLFLSGLFFGRAWCGWVCPAGGLAEICMSVNAKPVAVKKLRIIRYSVFTVWFAVLVAGFILAGGIRGIDPLHLTERVVSIDEPARYIVYYMVLLIFFILTIAVGRRGACHTICWMSPFLTAGMWLGRKLHLPQMRIRADADTCIDCRLCNKKCPMSIDVNEQVKGGSVRSLDCILCGECVDVCPEGVLSYRKKKQG